MPGEPRRPSPCSSRTRRRSPAWTSSWPRESPWRGWAVFPTRPRRWSARARRTLRTRWRAWSWARCACSPDRTRSRAPPSRTRSSSIPVSPWPIIRSACSRPRKAGRRRPSRIGGRPWSGIPATSMRCCAWGPRWPGAAAPRRPVRTWRSSSRARRVRFTSARRSTRRLGYARTRAPRDSGIFVPERKRVATDTLRTRFEGALFRGEGEDEHAEALDMLTLEGRPVGGGAVEDVPGPDVSDVVLHAGRRPAQGSRDDAIAQAQHVQPQKEPLARADEEVVDELGEPGQAAQLAEAEVARLERGHGQDRRRHADADAHRAQPLQAVGSGLLDRAIGEAGQPRGLSEVGTLTCGERTDTRTLDRGTIAENLQLKRLDGSPPLGGEHHLPVALNGSRVVPPQDPGDDQGQERGKPQPGHNASGCSLLSTSRDRTGRRAGTQAA